MNSFSATQPSFQLESTSPRRVRSVAIVAWGLIVSAALLLPISAITLLMLVAGSDGTANATVFGALSIVGGPPTAVVAGVGLLRRWRSAYGVVLALLASGIAWNLSALTRGPIPQRTYISPDGVPTTVLSSSVNVPLHLIIATGCVLIAAMLLRKPVRDEFGIKARARSTRPVADRASLRHLEVSMHAPSAHAPALPALRSRRTSPSLTALDATPKQMRALWLCIALVLGIAIAFGWLALSGFATEQAYLPVKRASQQRIVQRAEEPVLYWFSLGLYASLSAGALFLVGWGVRESSRARLVRESVSR